MLGPFGMLKATAGPAYCEVASSPKLVVVPSPPYNSAPAAKFSRHQTQGLGLAANPSGRVTPSAYPNSQGSPEKLFSPIKFSETFQPLKLLDRISFNSRERSISWRA